MARDIPQLVHHDPSRMHPDESREAKTYHARRFPLSDSFQSISGQNTDDSTSEIDTKSEDDKIRPTFLDDESIDRLGRLSPQDRSAAHLTRKADTSPSGEDVDVESQRAGEPNEQSQEPKKDPHLVEWDGPDDPENPMNWPKAKKWRVTLIMGSMTWVITFASSVFSTATVVTAEQYGVSIEVMILGVSLFVLGFAFGPVLWGPLSEVYGRKYPLFFGYFVMAIFQIAVAVAQNLHTIMICRFFGGFFGSAPLAIVGGAFVDFWEAVDRGVAVTIFAGATFIGPIAGPIVGGFIVDSSLGWRWTEYITAIMAFFFGFLAILFVPETYHPVLLQRRAKKLRYETNNWAIHSKHDEQHINIKAIASKVLVKPFVMMAKEPILVLVTIYMALVYGILYLFFEAFPIAFQQKRHWNEGVGALPFISIGIGVLLGGLYIIYTTKTRFKRKMEHHGRVIPEERLPPMIVGGFVFPAGLFWFAWTSSPNITWVPQVLSGIPIGAGILLIFLQGFNYIIDVYLMHAASAIAANTFVRSAVGAGFPLFATYMFDNLGVDWATSLLGFVCAALCPVPILFYIYGAKIRSLSKFAPNF